MNTVQAEPEKTLTTADFAGAAPQPDQQQGEASRVAQAQEQRQEQRQADDARPQASGAEHLAALFDPDVASRFRARWDEVQIGFVDDPRQAVRQADELVAQVMKSLAETFSSERASLEDQLEQTDSASTENLRVALRRYRSFFQRLLSL
ncbi:MAG TPA: hypothetical protein VN663_07775 [Ramlibacter sp.]|nr:hypothetical protein [Ramlibacter sp.]